MTQESTPMGTLTAEPAVRAPLSKMERRAAISGLFGTALEFYDFAVYGALAGTLLAPLFFNGLGDQGGLLVAFATYGVGYFARPIGALVFGHLGDKLGRKPILFITLAVMALGSIGIGVLPSHEGLWPAVLLVFFRLVQGFALGGEASGSQALVIEHSQASRRGILGALVFWGGPISQVITNLTLLLLTATLSQEQYSTWGWRIPFLLGVLIIVVAFYIRRRLEETPAFVAEKFEESVGKKSTRGAGLAVFRTHWREIIRLTLVWGPPNLVLQLMVVWALSRLVGTLGFPQPTVFLMTTISLAISVWFSLLSGRLSDRFNRGRLYLFSLPIIAIGFWLFLSLDKTTSPVVVVLVQVLTLAPIMWTGGIQPALFAERFPTISRFSGMAVPYTLGNLIFGAPAPLIATAVSAGGNTMWVLIITLIALAICVVATLTLRPARYVDELNAATMTPAPAVSK